MIILATIIIIIITLVYITWPWLKRYLKSNEAAIDDGFSGSLEKMDRFADNDEMGNLYSQRDAINAAVQELDFDVKSGTLSSDDYTKLKQNYKAEVESILKEIDDKEKGASLDGEIERQITELRKDKARFCPQCGERCREDDKFCVQCGTRLRKKRFE